MVCRVNEGLIFRFPKRAEVERKMLVQPARSMAKPTPKPAPVPEVDAEVPFDIEDMRQSLED